MANSGEWETKKRGRPKPPKHERQTDSIKSVRRQELEGNKNITRQPLKGDKESKLGNGVTRKRDVYQ